MTKVQERTFDLTTQWIGGKAVPSDMSDPIALLDPADGSPLADVPRGAPAEADAAVRAAHQAQPAWARQPVAERAALVREAGRRIPEHADEIATLLVRENGKPRAAAQAELAISVDWADELAHLAVHQCARSAPLADGELLFQQVTPRGVAICLNTWNAPVVAAVEMVVANLAVGNAVVLKTSERAPLATRLTFERCFDHLPAGVLSVVSGDGPSMGAPLTEHAHADVLCFIGSVGVGRKVGEAAGRRLRKAVLELGGKDALIVDADVDIEKAAAFAAPACFANSGQICTSIERIFVLQSVYESFVAALVQRARALKVGPGLEPDTEMGPLIDEKMLNHVHAQVDQAVRAGAKVHCGGQRLDRPGWYYPPTVITGFPDDCDLMTEETFGPIAAITPVASFDEAIERANRSTFGLGNIVLTESAPHAIAAIQQLQSGMVRINAPRGQATAVPAEPAKDSGLAFGHGLSFLNELTYRKSVRWRATL